MVTRFVAGETVQTPFGKGVVRELRGRSRLIVEVGGRRIEVDGATVKPLPPPRPVSRKRRDLNSPPPADPTFIVARQGGAPPEIDLHGLFVADALGRVEVAINDALLAGHLHLRVIHGRSGGRIRAALHQRLRTFPPVRAFRLDPHNEGVTIVDF